MLARPLTPNLRRPLTAAVTWTWIAVVVVVVGSLLVGGIVSLVSLVRSWIGDDAFRFPADLTRQVAWVAVPACLLASSWAAAYASAQRHLVRVVPAALVGAGFGALAFVHPAVGAIAGLGVAWSIAIPFESWFRLLVRWAGVAVACGAAAFTDLTQAWWIVAAIVAAAGPVLAALAVLAGEAVALLRRL